MRILIATDQWYPDLMGGVARVAAETARRLARAGHEVTVLAPEHAGAPERDVLEDGALMLLRVLPRRRTPKTIADTTATRRWGTAHAPAAFDVAIAHTSTTAYGLLSSKFEAPLIYVFHSDTAAESRYLRGVLRPGGRRWAAAVAFERPLRRLDKASLRGAASVVVLSRFSRGLLTELAPVAAVRAVQIDGAVDTDLFTPAGRDEARGRLGIPASGRLVFTVRRLVPRMGVENLLEAAAALRDVEGLQLAIAGRGSLERELRSRAERLELGEAVRFLGRVADEELPLWHRAADLFVLPTTAYEGFGLVTAEALASGTPVVGTPIGATPELLEPLEPRLLTAGSDPDDLAAGIRAGLELATPELRKRCRRRAVEHYSWDAVMPAWEALVAEAAAAGTRRQRRARGTRSAVLRAASHATCVGAGPFLARRTATRRRAGVLVYHDPTPSALEAQLDALARHHEFVSYDQLVEALRADDWSDIPPGALAVTIDDGHRGNAQLADVFEAYGVVPTIFLCTQVVGTDRPFWWTREGIDRETLKRVPNDERLRHLAALAETNGERQALSVAELRMLAGRTTFGAHTRVHPILPMCTDEVAELEIAGSKAEVEELTGGACLHFAFPNGDYGSRELDLVQRAGYRSARTIEPGWVDPAADPYRLPIVPMPDSASASRAVSQVAAVTFARPVLARRQAAASVAMSLTRNRPATTLRP
jgi:glycosyltransferase involved in cell wall biosynthesis/peptidoglycan/xylan/chitin deacetylase (PgdA/CDA1 family)